MVGMDSVDALEELLESDISALDLAGGLNDKAAADIVTDEEE